MKAVALRALLCCFAYSILPLTGAPVQHGKVSKAHPISHMLDSETLAQLQPGKTLDKVWLAQEFDRSEGFQLAMQRVDPLAMGDLGQDGFAYLFGRLLRESTCGSSYRLEVGLTQSAFTVDPRTVTYSGRFSFEGRITNVAGKTVAAFSHAFPNLKFSNAEFCTGNFSGILEPLVQKILLEFTLGARHGGFEPCVKGANIRSTLYEDQVGAHWVLEKNIDKVVIPGAETTDRIHEPLRLILEGYARNHGLQPVSAQECRFLQSLQADPIAGAVPGQDFIFKPDSEDSLRSFIAKGVFSGDRNRGQLQGVVKALYVILKPDLWGFRGNDAVVGLSLSLGFQAEYYFGNQRVEPGDHTKWGDLEVYASTIFCASANAAGQTKMAVSTVPNPSAPLAKKTLDANTGAAPQADVAPSAATNLARPAAMAAPVPSQPGRYPSQKGAYILNNNAWYPLPHNDGVVHNLANPIKGAMGLPAPNTKMADLVFTGMEAIPQVPQGEVTLVCIGLDYRPLTAVKTQYSFLNRYPALEFTETQIQANGDRTACLEIIYPFLPTFLGFGTKRMTASVTQSDGNTAILKANVSKGGTYALASGSGDAFEFKVQP